MVTICILVLSHALANKFCDRRSDRVAISMSDPPKVITPHTHTLTLTHTHTHTHTHTYSHTHSHSHTHTHTHTHTLYTHIERCYHKKVENSEQLQLGAVSVGTGYLTRALSDLPWKVCDFLLSKERARRMQYSTAQCSDVLLHSYNIHGWSVIM